MVAGALGAFSALTLLWHLVGRTELRVDRGGLHLRSWPLRGAGAARSCPTDAVGGARLRLTQDGEAQLAWELAGRWTPVMTTTPGLSRVRIQDMGALARDVRETLRRRP